jgi:hypothetical protein
MSGCPRSRYAQTHEDAGHQDVRALAAVKDYWGVIGLGAIVVVAMALVILGFATGVFSLTAVPN